MSADDNIPPDPRAHGPRVHVTSLPYVDFEGELLSIGVTGDGAMVVVRDERGVVQVYKIGPGGCFVGFIE